VNDKMWERVKEIFHQALKRPAEERGEFLNAACGDDDALRLEVGALLASHDEIGDDSLSSKVDRPNGREERVFPVEGPGTVIDCYKLLEEIGEGGMGVVYLAEQQQPVRRRVALKIIKLGMDTKEVIARFKAERQALSMMDHTHIAKMFDAGTTEQGRPYFVMEHVPGTAITEYCDQHRLNARERLELYIPVCKAIHHAHQRAIIHRDVKPSNVLVMVQDGEPVPKVIDFGVAKATNQRLTEKTLFTGRGVLIGTPVYMSPEQAEMTGLNVDTTTDVYSLGALLYELLAGAPPFDPKSLREAGLMAIHQMIREVEPPKPSTRFSSLGDEATTVAERRGTAPATLERQIRGELDWITMRAMEKDRGRRYQSASEFASDIERYLRDEPVVAGPPSTIYRIRKFARRHKAGVGLVVSAIVVLVAFALAMTIQAGRVARERDRAQMEATRSWVGAEVFQAMLFEDAGFDRGTALSDLAGKAREAWELHRQTLAGDPAKLALYATNLLYIIDWYTYMQNEASTEFRRLRGELEPEVFDLIGQAIADRDTSILKTVDLVINRINERGQKWAFKSNIEEQLYRDAIALRREVMSPGDPEQKRRLVKFAEYLESKGRRAVSEGRVSEAEPVFRELLEVRLEIDPVVSENSIALQRNHLRTV
jgi:serine/threonine protein kinase